MKCSCSWFCFFTEDPYPSSSIDLKCKERVSDSDSENASGDEGGRKVTEFLFLWLLNFVPAIVSSSYLLWHLHVLFFREFLLLSSAHLPPLLHHITPPMAGVSRCPLTPQANAMMRGGLEGEGFQITGGRREGKEKERTILWSRVAEVCRPLLSPSPLVIQSFLHH